MEFNVEKILSKMYQKIGVDVVKIPKHGFLCGQSVCSAILEIYFNGRNTPIYNDYDIFVETNNESTPMYSHSVNSDYGVMQGYSIIDTTYVGKLNIIEYMNSSVYDNPLSIYQLIELFDINCVQVGIDLSTRTLHYTQEFMDFCISNELKVINFSRTPTLTLLRLLNKRSKLRAYSNIMPPIEYITDHLNSSRDCRRDSIISDQKRIKYVDEIRYLYQINQFTLRELIPGDKYSYDDNSRLITFNKSTVNVYKMYILIPNKVLNAKYDIFIKNTNPIYLRYHKANNTRIYRALTALVSCIPTSYNKPYPHPDAFTDNNIAKIYLNSTIADLDPKSKKLRFIYKLIVSHNELLAAFKHPGLFNNLNEIHAHFSILNRISNNFDSETIYSLTEMFKYRGMGFDYINQMFESTINNQKDNVYTTRKLEGLKIDLPNVKIKELISEFDIKQEGNIMRNCIGGYGTRLKEGKLLLLSIEIFDTRYNIEISLRKPLCGDSLKQFVGKSNKSPQKDHTIYFNDNLLPKILDHLR
jgi:hypothetical protein